VSYIPISKAVETFFIQNPLLSRYVRMGLVNITALAQHMKKRGFGLDSKNTVSAIAMTIRRYFIKLPTVDATAFIFSNTPYHLVVRSNISELIFTKDTDKRLLSRSIFQKISNLKHFSCLVEGEREIVVMTDCSLHELMKESNVQKSISYQTTRLGFISVNLPIRLREVVGVYGLITSTLAVAQIPIHSFHTIGGEILILVKNEDLSVAQEVLANLLTEN